jgi:hypothetical protein
VNFMNKNGPQTSHPAGVPSFDPNYANARGKDAASANEEEAKDNNPGVSPASLPDHMEEKVLKNPEPRSKVQLHDDNYAQYMNRGSGRYEEFLPDQNMGSFGPDRDHGEKTWRIHRHKSRFHPKV